MILKTPTGEELLDLWQRATRLARGSVRDQGLAEEIASEAVARLLARPQPDVEDGWSFIYIQVRDLCANDRRRARRTKSLDESGTESGLSDPGAPRTQLDHIWVEELVRIAREEAEFLPEPERRVVVAHLFEELTFLGKACERHARLSLALDSTVHRTRHRLSRGLIRLRARLERRLRRTDAVETSAGLLVLVPLLPQLLSRAALAPEWRRASSSPAVLVPVVAGLGVLTATVATAALATPRSMTAEEWLEPAALVEIASAAAEPTPAVPDPPEVVVSAAAGAPVLLAADAPGARRARGRPELFREDFQGEPVHVIAPRCDEGTSLPLGDSGWQVLNLRSASCFPSRNTNVAAIQADGLRIAADANDAFGGYVGVHHELPFRPLEWVLTVRVTVVQVEDPLHRPVPQCFSQFGPNPRFEGDEQSVGWCTVVHEGRAQVLALRDPGGIAPADYVVEPGVEHTIELVSTRAGSELRAWHSLSGARPEAPLAKADSLGEMHRILFTGPNWKEFDYRVHAVRMRPFGAVAYGTCAANSTGRGARLAAFADPDPVSGATRVELVASGLPPRAAGRFIVGASCDPPPFDAGSLLVSSDRRVLALAQADGSGCALVQLDELGASLVSPADGEVYLQFLYADPGWAGARNATPGVRLLP